MAEDGLRTGGKGVVSGMGEVNKADEQPDYNR